MRLKNILLKLFLLIILSSVAEAQVKNALLGAGGYEPSVAINRDDVKNIVASSAPHHIYYTRDGGLSWEKTELTSVYGTVNHLSLLADFKNNFYCLAEVSKNGKSRAVIYKSSNGGQTWSEGTLVTPDTVRYAAYPKAAIDGKGNLFVTWTEFESYGSDNANCVSRILLSRSSNGKKWTKPMELSQVNGKCKNDDNTPAGAWPAVMEGGQRAFAAWANQSKIFFDRSFDGGAMWLMNDLPIAEQVGGWQMNIPGVQEANGMPVLLINTSKRTNLTGALYLMWADQLRGEQDTDIWFTRSLNFGDHWDQPGRVNEDAPGKHQYLPYMTFDSKTGYLYIIYYDRRSYDDERSDIYIAWSNDSGSSFRNVKISETPFVADATVPIGRYIGIAAHDGVVTPVWTRTENGSSSVWISIIKQADLEGVKKN